MLRAIGKCEKEESRVRIVCSTTHKAKGREWSYVRIDFDFEAAFARSSTSSRPNQKRPFYQASFDAEARLLYVAITRAKIAVHIPRTIMSRFSLRPTTMGTIGRESGVKIPEDKTSRNAVLPSLKVVSSYHSPRSGESREMVALRKLLR